MNLPFVIRQLTFQVPTFSRTNSLVLLQYLGSARTTSLSNQIKYGNVLKKNLLSS